VRSRLDHLTAKRGPTDVRAPRFEWRKTDYWGCRRCTCLNTGCRPSAYDLHRRVPGVKRGQWKNGFYSSRSACRSRTSACDPTANLLAEQRATTLRSNDSANADFGIARSAPLYHRSARQFLWNCSAACLHGIFGIISYLVAQRNREFGIRMALGANRSQITQLVLLRGARIAIIGCLCGLTLFIFASRLLLTSLYRTKWYDPLRFASYQLSSLLWSCSPPGCRHAKLPK
jgi:FtsX-like permease family